MDDGVGTGDIPIHNLRIHLAEHTLEIDVGF